MNVYTISIEQLGWLNSVINKAVLMWLINDDEFNDFPEEEFLYYLLSNGYDTYDQILLNMDKFFSIKFKNNYIC